MSPGRVSYLAMTALCLSLGAVFPGCAQESDDGGQQAAEAEGSAEPGQAAALRAAPEEWFPSDDPGGDTSETAAADPGDATSAAGNVPPHPTGYEAGRASFDIKINSRVIGYETFFAAVPANGDLDVLLGDNAPADDYVLVGPDGGTTAFAEGAASWRAPDAPGQSRTLTVRRGEGGARDEIALEIFIEQPVEAMEGEYLNGYRIGAYPREALRGLAIYEPPTGFIEVTEENQDMRISPHFTLGQFLCHQQADHWPKYLLIEPRMILKLEALLERINDEGIDTDEMFVMSGYRTPWYNRAIGNTTTYSRHVYGGASDIYVDVAPRDGDMDDLDGDGQVTIADADWLFDEAVALERSDEYSHLVGGLGKYDRNAAHGPFLHVDARGYEARW